MFHTYVTPPKGTVRFDGGPELAMPRFAFLPVGAPIQWRSAPCIIAICNFGPDFISGLVAAEPISGSMRSIV